MPNGKAIEKYILCNNLLYTPQELKIWEVKKPSHGEKKSIKHKGKPLQKFFTSRALQEQEGSMIEQAHQQQGGTALDLPRQNLIDMDGIFDELESKLSNTIEEVVRSTMSALKSSIENEIKHLTQKVDNLTFKVVELENAQHTLTERCSEQLARSQSLSQELASQAIQTQIKHIEDCEQSSTALGEKRKREQEEQHRCDRTRAEGRYRGKRVHFRPNQRVSRVKIKDNIHQSSTSTTVGMEKAARI